MGKTDKRTERFELRLTTKEKKELAKRAEELGLSLSVYLRMKGLKK